MVLLEDIQALSSYLKSKTPYGVAFEGVASIKMNRARLEGITSRMVFMREDKLLKYAGLQNSGIDGYIALKREAELITSCARNNGSPFITDPYLMYLPEHMRLSGGLDITKLENAEGPQSLLSALEHTSYHRLLAPVLKNELYSFPNLQNTLTRYVFDKSTERFSKTLCGKEKEDVLGLLSEMSDIITLSNIYRIVKYYGRNEKMLISVFTSDATKLDEKKFSALCGCKTSDELDRAIENTPYKGFGEKYGQDGNMCKRATYDLCRKTFAKTTCPTLCAICYLELIRTEKSNISAVSEAIGYKMTSEEILPLIIS